LHSHNEHFFQVGLLDQALISLGLTLNPPSTSVSSDFMVLCKCFSKIILTSLYLVEVLAGRIGPLPGGLTNYCPLVLDIVGWVTWPVKINSNMTYNVFGGTLNPTLLQTHKTYFFNFGIAP